MNRNRLFFIVYLTSLAIILGCGKPNDPESLGGDGGYKIVKKHATSGFAQDVVVRDNIAYIAQGEGGLEIVDVTDLQDIKRLSTLFEPFKGSSIEIELIENMVFLANGSKGGYGIDVNDPLNPAFKFRMNELSGSENFSIMGNYLWTAIDADGAALHYIKNPYKPDNRPTLRTAGYPLGIAATSDSSLLMIACGELGLFIHNLSDFQQGFGSYEEVAWCDTPGMAEDVILLEDNKLAFLACGTAGLQIINYADTNNVHIVAAFDGGGYAKELKIKNNRIYIAAELAGLQIVDISQPTNPYFVGSVDTEFALGFDLDDDYIYLADEDEGLIIISIPD